MPLAEFCNLRGICLDEAVKGQIDSSVRRAAYSIIEGKGSTYYGIGSALAQIVDVILHNQRSILTVCTPMANVEGVDDVTVSLPHLVGGAGALDTFPLPMSDDERRGLRKSAVVVKEAIQSIS
jgi:L-lactate dehydrogenase